MKYPYFRGLEADRYSFYRVPKALIKVDLFEKMSGDAKLLYAVLLDRMNLSLKNGWQDEDGNAYIICTMGLLSPRLTTGTRQAWQRRQGFYRYLNVAALPCSLIPTPPDDEQSPGIFHLQEDFE